MVNDLIIHDEEYDEYKEKLNSIAEDIEEKFVYLTEQLRMVCTYGIIEGNVHDNLSLFVGALDGMKGQLAFFTDQMGVDSMEYIAEVEKLDCAIYEGGRE